MRLIIFFLAVSALFSNKSGAQTVDRELNHLNFGATGQTHEEAAAKLVKNCIKRTAVIVENFPELDIEFFGIDELTFRKPNVHPHDVNFGAPMSAWGVCVYSKKNKNL